MDPNHPNSDEDDYNVLKLINRVTHSTQKHYAILNQTDLIQRQQQDINKVSTVLSIPTDHACILLLSYNWSVGNVQEAWFDDEARVRKRVGLLDVGPETVETVVDCGVCYESVRTRDAATCGCGHAFCKTCWKSYVGTAVEDGIGCLGLRCPEPGCGAAVGPEMVNALVGGEVKRRYDLFLVRSYVESNKMIKWCPGPGCDKAVLFDDEFETGGYDVCCECKCCFCWNCLEDAHRPLGCETVAKWLLKNTNEAENTNWILAYTKPCPKCKRSIEKNNGCMHMACRPPCGYHFCWLCLGPYNGHDGIACNKYTEQKGPDPEAEKQRGLARKAIQRYTHYYERWAANERSRKQALLSLHKIETVHLKKLGFTHLQFIKDAWLQIVECRRMLKWTYAYGYYLPKTEQAKIMFFEYVQGEAEAGLERLHRCAEKELQTYIRSEEATAEQFNDFRVKLVGLTRVTRTYFENLSRALENGLSEVDTRETCAKKLTGLGQRAAVGSRSKVGVQKRSSQVGESSDRASDNAKRLRIKNLMMKYGTGARRDATQAAGESSSRGHLGGQDW